jgi:NAD(P)-dependent dehydrogenase (short-subunit alcohol dehydrogenase family)
MDVNRPAVEALATCLGNASVPVPTDPEAIASATAAILNRFGTLDILVNNADIFSNNKMQEADLDEWQTAQSVNVEAAFLLTRAFLPAVRAQRRGRFVLFGCARDRRAGMTVNAIAPAYVLPPMGEGGGPCGKKWMTDLIALCLWEAAERRGGFITLLDASDSEIGYARA